MTTTEQELVPTPLTINCTGMLNGIPLDIRGSGTGVLDDGKLAMEFEFSEVPKGVSVWISALWTACCSTPTFAKEQANGYNMMSLTKGRYRCDRVFDFGKHGNYNYNYRLKLEDGKMAADGVLYGDLNLPEIDGISAVLFETMNPVGPREMRSRARSVYSSASGEDVPVTVEGVYRPLPEDDTDWLCWPQPQVRRSDINVFETTEKTLSLEYTTVIRGLEDEELYTARS